jgi:hypothetical protein
MRELPCFGDLMLLPKAIDRHAQTELVNQQIKVRNSDVPQMVAELSIYPHIKVEAHDDVVVVSPQEAAHKRVLISWPDGRMAAVLLWQDVFYSRIAIASALDLVTAGYAFETLEVGENTELDELLDDLRLR